MKRKTSGHPKFEDFAESLDLRRYQAAGILELLWHFTADYAPDGAVGRFSDKRIASKLEYDGDPGKLVLALCETRWLDRDVVDVLAPGEPARLYVHNWHVHAEDGVHRVLARGKSLFADGHLPKTTRLQPAERRDIELELARLYPEHVRTYGARSALRHGLRHGPLKNQSGQLVPGPHEVRAAAHDVRTSEPPAAAAAPARAPAARSRGAGGSGTRGALNVGLEHLTQERACAELYDRAHELGRVLERRADGVLVTRARSEACRVAFFTLARYSVRTPNVKNPCALFVAKLAKAEWSGSETDQAWALERLRVLDGSPLAGVAEALEHQRSAPAPAPVERSTDDACAHCGIPLPCAAHDPRPGETVNELWIRIQREKRELARAADAAEEDAATA